MNKPGQCRSDTCKTHAADESPLGSLETDYEVKGQIRKRLECKKKAFTFDATVKRKLPQFQWGVSCWHWENISLAFTIKQLTKDWRPIKMWQSLA